MNHMIQKGLRLFPAVHRILEDVRIKELLDSSEWSREYLVREIGSILHSLRQKVLNGEEEFLYPQQIIDKVYQILSEVQKPNLRRVINATGVILHTNLGRAVISASAVERMMEVAGSYSNLEYDILNGERSSRHEHVEEIICRLTGAEAAMVVNNNAAAVFLVLREMAKDREVIVSRGQLVEIGGSFRISEIMRESGAHLVEVGTTNKTKLQDYERVINEQTALLLKVHTSNFRIVGFTESVETKELVKLGEKYGIPVYEDLGSGVLYDIRKHGIGDEPTVAEVINAGVDLVSFSGDKLLGGPQAGIIAGKKKWIDRLKKNQLARVLRVDKVTLTGLEETLRLYFTPEKAVKEIPALRHLLISQDVLRMRAEKLVMEIKEKNLLNDWNIQLANDFSEVGGGSLPTVQLPTWVVTLSHPVIPAQKLERYLRLSTPSVITRIYKEQVIMDLRTVQEHEVEEIIKVLEGFES